MHVHTKYPLSDSLKILLPLKKYHVNKILCLLLQSDDLKHNVAKITVKEVKYQKKNLKKCLQQIM